jgi:hypothetical protein
MVNDGATTQIVDTKPEGIFEDDWDRLLRDREAAAIGPNGELLDDFDQEFQLGVQKSAEAAAQAPPTNQNPASATTAILGGQATPTAGQPSLEVARWVGQDSEATNFTITAQPIRPPTVINPPNGNISANAFLIIQWGVRSYTWTIEVDIGTGVELTLTGSFVSVSIAVDPGFVVTQGQQITAGISFREGNRTSLLTRTIYDYTGGAQSVSIPPFAKKVFLVPSSATATISFNFQQPDATVTYTGTIPAATVPPAAIIIPPGSTILNFQPSGGTAQAIFELNV